MKLLLLSVALILLKGEGHLMHEIYLHQKSFYNEHLKHKIDYVSIINFARQGRAKLYQQQGVQLATLRDCIILEGYSAGWGNYCGLLISKHANYAYRNGEQGGWEMQLVRDEESIAIPKHIIDHISTWDTAYIRQQTMRLGSSISDGYVFMATRVQYAADKHVKLETIAFNEFSHFEP